MRKIIEKKNKGFISIFAIFFSAIVISILTSLYILLVKQIEIMNLDASSFQALYVADSAFECALFKEQSSTSSDDSVFLPQNSGSFGNCLIPGDSVWLSNPTLTVNGVSKRSKSKLQVSMLVNNQDFCSTVTTDKENGITALFVNAPIPDSMIISGQSRNCTDNTTKAIERVVEFYY